MTQVNITDTILRDAHQCLIATRMRTEDMLEACPMLDKVGFWSLEMWGGATFDACVRFLKEDPWARLKALRNALPNTQTQMLLRGQNLLGYRHYADDVVNAFVKKAANNGIDVFRIFDALNDVRNMQCAIEAVKKAGKHAQGAISFTISPVHNEDSFVALAVKLQDLGCDSIAIKDMAGLLTPVMTEKLMQALQPKVEVPIHLHSHATSGLSALCHYEGVRNGCRHIDTAISAFSEGASHACTESMVAAFQNTPYDTKLDLGLLQEIGVYFKQVRKKYARFESDGTGIDTRVQINQVPGGMISNLYNQLQTQNALDKLEEVLQEIPKVREDLGYPPLVTPTSQIVGTQALLNVITGKRYQTITNEVKLYLQGKYGTAPGTINKTVQRQAIGKEDVIDVRPADLLKPEMETLRQESAEIAQSEEDVLIVAMFPDIGREFLQQRASGELTPEPLTLESEASDTGGAVTGAAPHDFKVTLHGETYDIQVTGTGSQTENKRPFYLTVDGIPEEILVEIESEDVLEVSASSTGRTQATNPGDVSTSMPGVIVDILVSLNQEIEAGTPVLVIEAMKMETEIQAPVSGKITAINVAKGDNVNPNEALMTITMA